MGRQQLTGVILDMPPQASVTTLKWQSMSEHLYICFLSSFVCFLLEMQFCLYICIIPVNILTLIPFRGFSAHRYTDEWNKVQYCMGITNTNCDLSSLVHEYDIGYKVRVQLVVETNASAWIRKKFLPNTSRCGKKSAPKTLKL